ncbi:DNA helicase MCM9 [Cephus cinctus]|uniref:DNA helicase MCM9 n=1 Tax=Cephus cinctus TaxID=211228 RepID=A0AAJ7C0T4_CEPCN|nr:DNA helicase MCM9 [Cephus cinctus]
MLVDYFLKYHSEDLRRILDAQDEPSCYSINIDFVSLYEADCEIANKVLRRPRIYLPQCDEDAITAQENVLAEGQTIKRRIHTRISSVPQRVDQGQIGELVFTAGITVRTSQPTVIKLLKHYECRKCKHITTVKLEWERQIFPDTKECSACHAKNITHVTALHLRDCADYQEIKIQEKCQLDESSSYTVGMQIILLDDLIDKCRPGDHVDVCGMVIRRWPHLTAGTRSEATTVMIANSVSVQRKLLESTFSTEETREIFTNYWKTYSDDPLVGRNQLLASICPQIYGLYTVKLAMAVVLAGGVSKTNESGTRVRGEPHLLMIGDPGTGKSQLLRAASRLALRSVLTTGIGTTAAGLTAAAVKDGDGWHLEGGALVLADGGVCCVDEFATMRSHDRASVHEAMEQQTISVAKAGIVSTLNSRCTVVAAINPSGGRFLDDEEYKTTLGNPLLSRFDLILILKDNKNPEWDRITSDHILKLACESPESLEQHQSKIDVSHANLLKTDGLWKEESLRKYLAYVHTLKPILSEQAAKIVSAVYLHHRSNPYRRAERTTVRLLDSLIRLAEGHARLMFRNEVNVMDALVAAQLIGTTVTTKDNIGCPFPRNPRSSYLDEGAAILHQLELDELIDYM